MTWMEWLSTALGVACVALGVVRSVWTFPTAIGSVVLLGIVVFDQRLYSDAVLQGCFVALNLYGWHNWRRSRAAAGEVVVERLGGGEALAWAVTGAVLAAGWGTAMHRLTDASYPYWDAGIAVASIAGQLLMARRKLENWAVWIAVDLASIPLYLAKGLWAFAGLYVVYLGLSLWGLAGWRRVMRAAGPVVA